MKFRADIQRLRAIAVLLVIFAHVGIPGFDGGWIGVDVFFVISGFLITGLLSNEYSVTRSVSFTQFYLRRAKRILPASIVAILVVVLASELLLNSVRSTNIRTDAIWALGFSANINFIRQSTDYFASSQAVSPLQHFWSLAVEEQFYLLWPGLFLLAARQRSPVLRRTWITKNKRMFAVAGSISALSLLWSISYTSSNPSSAYFSTLTRLWELGFGALLSVLTPRLAAELNKLLPDKRDRIRAAASWGGLTLILLGACVIIKPGDPFPGWLALLPVLGAVGLIFGGQGDAQPLPNRLLALRPLPFIGLISFSLYLWHWPIHVFADALYPDSVNTAAGKAVQLTVIAAFSLVSYRYIERPARASRFGHREPVVKPETDATRFPRSAIAAAGIGAIFLFIVANAAGNSADIFDTETGARTTTPTTSISGGLSSSVPISPGNTSGPTLAAWRQTVNSSELRATVSPAALDLINQTAGKRGSIKCDRNIPNGCFIGSTGPTVALLGDSHSRMILPMIRSALPDWQIHSYGAGNCGWALIEFANPVQERGNGVDEERCRDIRTTGIAAILQEKPAIIMLSEDSRWVINDSRKQEWVDGLNATIREFEALSPDTKIVIFGEVPRAERLESCLSGSSIARCSINPEASRWLRDQQRTVAAGHPNVSFIDSEQLLCTSTSCPAVIDDIPVYSDNQHFTTQFAERLGPIFKEYLGL